MDYIPPGSSVHRIFQARILEPFLPPGDRSDPGIELPSFCVSCIVRQILYHQRHLRSSWSLCRTQNTRHLSANESGYFFTNYNSMPISSLGVRFWQTDHRISPALWQCPVYVAPHLLRLSPGLPSCSPFLAAVPRRSPFPPCWHPRLPVVSSPSVWVVDLTGSTTGVILVVFGWRTSTPISWNSNFSLENLTTNTVSYFGQGDRLPLFIFKKMCRKTTLCVSLLKTGVVLQHAPASNFVCFSCCHRKCFKKLCATQGSRFTKSSDFKILFS